MIDAGVVAWLVTQIACAAAGLWILRRRVYPALTRAAEPGQYVDVWLPLVIVTPLLFFAARVDGSVRGIGWPPVGGAACVGCLAVMLVLLVRRSEPGTAAPPVEWTTTAAAVGTGLLLLLLCAAHELTIWVGQVIFALVALLLWLNTSRTTSHARVVPHEPRKPGGWTFLAVLVAAAQGGSALAASASTLVRSAGVLGDATTRAGWSGAASVTVAIVYGILATIGARSLGPATAVRLGQWTAVLGTLLGISVLSLGHLLAASFGVVATGGRALVLPQVAYGFGVYAPEAALLCVFPWAPRAAAWLPAAGWRGGCLALGVLVVIILVLRIGSGLLAS